ncbi:DUF5908 family protein [Chryseobacterium oryctis]|uniref:DUF5908 family protein n=1 Tax=Chryseobacterium oryctis TaxID=2952618 RepID=A0ABT3HRP9_9FLAO|nr:DUF5908 family protein [Chryseobacterium oryctis]MCW3162455.1 DUF5908 family protein [Chryseobacterium oryctis]
MAIEIKELKIKINVSEPQNSGFPDHLKMNTSKFQEMKTEIVNECIRKVLEKIKEKSER